MASSSKLRVGNRDVDVTNLDKIFYPDSKFTKGDVLDYYISISSYLLPHLKNRPITLKRYPNGVQGMFFYEKHCPSPHPNWIKTTKIPKSDGSMIDYLTINDLPSLVWAANLANLELHTFLHKVPRRSSPTVLAFDLDPGPPADVITCCQVALWLRGMFESLGLKSFAKTSGSKGMQIYVPLNTVTSYEKTKEFAHSVANTLAEQFPKLVVADMKKSLRKGKVLIDWSQNDEHKTTVAVYSLRAKDHPTVSTPVTWKEVETALKKKKSNLLVFETSDVLKRVKAMGDLFKEVLTLKQKLPKL